MPHTLLYNGHSDIFRCSSWTYLAVVKGVFLRASLDEELVCQSPILRTITVAVSCNPACLPVSIKSSLETCVLHKRHIIVVVI